MKSEDPLAAALLGLPVPPPSPAARERALHRATIALRQSVATPDDAASRQTGRRFAMNWGLAGALAMLVALAIGTFWRFERPRQTEAIAAQSLEIDRMVLGQIEALFGPQLNAVVERPGAPPDIRLAEGDEGEAGHSQPVLIEFTRGVDTIRVLGYSGRPVSIDLAGRRTRFEPLATGDGEVILSGDSFCWTPRDRAGQVAGYRVATRLLSSS